MQMTNEEIIASYRRAVDRRKQIRILSELNNVKQSVIADILKAAGEEVPSLKGRSKPIDVEAEVAQANAADRGQQLPDETAERVPSETVPSTVSEPEPCQIVFHRAEQVLLLLRETDPPELQRDIVLLASALTHVDATRAYGIKFNQ